jgi:adenylate kinase
VLNRIVLIGPPGTSKGTQAKIIASLTGFVHVCAGDILRDEIKSGSEKGKEIASIIDGGNLVPDEMISGMIRDKVEGKSGFLCDGFPRTIGQAEIMARMTPIDIVLNFTTSEDEIVRRILARRNCPNCGRIHSLRLNPLIFEICPDCGHDLDKREDDSDEKIIRHRISVYHKKSAVLIGYYKKIGILCDINGEQSVQKVTQDILQVLSNSPDA